MCYNLEEIKLDINRVINDIFSCVWKLWWIKIDESYLKEEIIFLWSSVKIGLFVIGNELFVFIFKFENKRVWFLCRLDFFEN